MKILTVICLLLIATICTPLKASGGDASGSITGTVEDASEAVVDRAVIEIRHWQGSSPQPSISLRSDSQGRFSATVAPGIYDVFVSCNFCSPQAKQVEVKSGAKATIVFKMKFSRYMKSTD